MNRLIRTAVILALTICLLAPAEELFRDLALQQGLNLSAVTSRSRPLILKTILQEDDTGKPIWRLAQWGTKYDLSAAEMVVREDGTRLMKNAGKAITIHPGGLSGDGVTLAVYGGVEYGGHLRKQGEPWPHLLVEQGLSSDFRLADYARVYFSLDFKVERCDVATTEAVDRSLHTGQVTAYFSIRNDNRESADFNDAIWFGLPLYDVRHDLPGGHQAVDGGKDDATGMFICTLPGKRFYDTPTGDGAWHELRGDLVPLVKEALAASQAKGFLKDTVLEDLRPT
ncbi:MAG: hypothetical protein L3K26_03915 [Candidatus Hydrogenedentes bacterium]|nr:hypothetical protein [Candidatus Hydrogenedentota bacterium]